MRSRSAAAAACRIGGESAPPPFEASVERVVRAEVVAVDLGPFLEVGRLLYQGPGLADRSLALEPLLAHRPESVHPVVRDVLVGAADVRGTDVFRGLHAVAEAQASTAPVWRGVDALLVPTTPTVGRLLADPVAANAWLGGFTTFVNLLDLAGVAAPSVVGDGRVPVGVTFLGLAGTADALLGLAAAWQDLVDLPVTVSLDPLESRAAPSGAARG